MDDALSRGLPFELADIWQRSTLQVKDDDPSVFTPLDAVLPPLELDTKHETFTDELIIPPIDDLDRPPQSQDLEPPESDIASPPSELWDAGQTSQDDPASVWDFDLNLDAPPNLPRLRTWEAFEKKDEPNHERTEYFSEAGPAAFDAFLAQRESNRSGVLPQDVTLRAFCNLVLGRASVFFQWDDTKAKFTRTLQDVPVSGYSSATCDGLTHHLMDYATRFRSLRASSSEMRAKSSSQPCAIAFSGSVNSVLDAIEEHVTTRLPQIRSHLQLQGLIERPSWLLVTLERMSSSIRKANSDEAIISGLSDNVHEAVSVDSSFAAVLRLILERTSTPWLEQLARDVGLVDDPVFTGNVQPGEDANASAMYLSTSTAATENENHEVAGFMEAEDRELARTTEANLRILRQTLPQHAGDEEARRLYKASLRSNPGSALFTHSAQGTSQGSGNAAFGRESLVWQDEEKRYEYLAQMDKQMSDLPQSNSNMNGTDNLRQAVLSYCIDTTKFSELSDSLTPPLSTIDPIRPALSAQNRHLNLILLRNLFANSLIHHLHLQNSYHFLSSGEFVTRLSTALFSTAETQSAERKRGTIPTGQTMGLRLGDAARTEQRWPPASSELRLTLADVLTEAYHADHPTARTSKGPTDLPGGLSFSIRELPDPEIERVMDASSIYALDFLKLQYTPPPPLDAIFTPSALQAYDAVFRLLVRMLRALHVTASLTSAVANRHRTISKTNDGAEGAAAKFAQRAHAFVCTLFSHTKDVGIAAPWEYLLRRVRALEADPQGPESERMDLETLQRWHSSTLETIRSRLFLRRKQEKLRLAVEGVLGAILRGAVVLEGRRDGEEMESEVLSAFESAVKELLRLLRAAVDKPPSGRKAKGDGDEDEGEVLRVLLGRLEWNGFYSVEGKDHEA